MEEEEKFDIVTHISARKDYTCIILEEYRLFFLPPTLFEKCIY